MRGDELDLIIKDAEAKLAASRVAGASIGNLPLVFLVGDQGSTKTSVVLQSGLAPELLAGQIYGDNNVIVPTRTANLWLAGNTVFAEAGPKILAEPAKWVRMIRRLRPGNLKSVVGGNAQAPRAALVCVNSEIFTQPGAADALSAMSRALSERLGNISQALGISFPVYVLFTRTDRLPFFLDYVRTLSNDEGRRRFSVQRFPCAPPQAASTRRKNRSGSPPPSTDSFTHSPTAASSIFHASPTPKKYQAHSNSPRAPQNSHSAGAVPRRPLPSEPAPRQPLSARFLLLRSSTRRSTGRAHCRRTRRETSAPRAARPVSFRFPRSRRRALRQPHRSTSEQNGFRSGCSSRACSTA